ncbi:1-acylglycerol-3-phosphate O-acyltransferase [Ophidiomyces ophidiicola]|nr:1-acylglycerol-3-phosphate O-acyltransferase [Ophidiomyces ophidiicola]KAI1985151.1 1-acylglycerol-3-phosphate O-acyltransferase [Ophidiomyces ophidiicola]KAI1995926.1 1-acylglycerol-3-phosphate O-acyltransferase [Ophidiomyces ophidiicola]KAI1997940.1 1-acylglycerol-3-phosphate O-acyltransferase [Ophidiomyces ophidiicola]
MSILSYIFAGLGSYVALTVGLFGLSLRIPQAGFFARCLAAYASLLLCAGYGVFASIFLRVVGYGQVSQWAAGRCFKWVMWLSTGVHFDIVEGKQHLATRPAVFIGNHQTELDVLMLGAVFPPYCSVTAKKSLRNVPVLGWFMALSGTVFIDRANRQTALKAFDGAAEQMKKQKQSVFIFPEGTRSYSAEPCLLPFKKGAFHLAVQAGVDIVPVVVENYSHVLNIKKWRFSAGSIRIKVLPAISTHGFTSTDVDSLAIRTRETMLAALMDLNKLNKGSLGYRPVDSASASLAQSSAVKI